MNYYVTAGRNGAIIKTNYQSALYCRKYLPQAIVRKYSDFPSAEQAAIEHICSITPPYIKCPDRIEIDVMITVNKLIKQSQGIKEPGTDLSTAPIIFENMP